MSKNIIINGKVVSMGSFLLDAGKINDIDIGRIIALQKQKGLCFGDAAKELGLIKDEDIQKALSRKFDFPFVESNEEYFSRELVAAYQPFSEHVEALRAVRGQLMLRWFVDDHKTFALVSHRQGIGCSYMAANLAIVFSQLGKRTILIDANLRQPRQHELFKLTNTYGLSDLLAGLTDLSSVISSVPVFQNLSVLPAGEVPPNPVELISRGFKNCLQQLQTQFDVILIDTPPVEQCIDAQIITSNCGGALLVARRNETRLNDLQLLKDALQTTGGQCLCVLLIE